MMKTILAVCMLGLFAPGAAFAEDYDARLTELKGEVDVQAAGDGDWREAEDGMPLAAGDRVRTGEGSSAEITLDDGGLLRLDADSSLEISSVQSGAASFRLALGSILAKIRAGFLKRNERFEVRTPPAVCAVRGTEFGVEHDEDSGETTAGVFDEGSVSVSSLDEGGAVLAEGTLEKGSEVGVRKGARALKPGAMRRLLRHRKTMEKARGRMGWLQKNWKRLTPEKRQELRGKFAARKAVVRKLREKTKGGAPGRGRAGPGKRGTGRFGGKKGPNR